MDALDLPLMRYIFILVVRVTLTTKMEVGDDP